MKLIENIISFTIIIVIGGLLIAIFTTQQKQRQAFDEQTVQNASKKKTSAEKRIEKEHSTVESINASLDAKDSENNTLETTQTITAEGNDEE